MPRSVPGYAALRHRLGRRHSEPLINPVTPLFWPCDRCLDQPASSPGDPKGGGAGRCSAHHAVGPCCLCATCASAPASPSCPHPRPWRRLRAKRGFTFYACRDCGAKWRALTPSRVAALEPAA
eukprot:EG_transcript_20273